MDRRHRERANATLEMALLLPLLCTIVYLIYGITETFRVRFAAQEAARFICFEESEGIACREDEVSNRFFGEFWRTWRGNPSPTARKRHHVTVETSRENCFTCVNARERGAIARGLSGLGKGVSAVFRYLRLETNGRVTATVTDTFQPTFAPWLMGPVEVSSHLVMYTGTWEAANADEVHAVVSRFWFMGITEVTGLNRLFRTVGIEPVAVDIDVLPWMRPRISTTYPWVVWGSPWLRLRQQRGGFKR